MARRRRAPPGSSGGIEVRSASAGSDSATRASVAAELLVAPAALEGIVEQGSAALAAEHPRAPGAVRRAVAAAGLLADWSWALAVAGAGALVLDDRVPDLDPASLALQVVAGDVVALALLSPSFACGPHDPDRARPEAQVVPDRIDVLRARLTAHLAPLHLRLRAGDRPLLRRGARAMWGAAGDGVASALWRLGRHGGVPGRYVAAADQVLSGAPAAWGAAGFRELSDPAGRVHLTRRRNACCLYYRLPDTPVCLTCPRLTDQQRSALLARRAT
jgi:hypothetical protein